jgi:hypothetical protein
MFANHPSPRGSKPTTASHIRVNDEGTVYIMVRGFPTGHMRSNHGEALWGVLLDGELKDDLSTTDGVVQIVSKPVFTRSVKRGDQVEISEGASDDAPAFMRVVERDQWIEGAPITVDLPEAVEVPLAPVPPPILDRPNNNPKEGDRFRTKYGQVFMFQEGSWAPEPQESE